MSACEKCWRDAGGNPEAYYALLKERKGAEKACSPEEHAGPDASDCPNCKRKTVHQYAHACVICEWRPRA